MRGPVTGSFSPVVDMTALFSYGVSRCAQRCPDTFAHILVGCTQTLFAFACNHDVDICLVGAASIRYSVTPSVQSKTERPETELTGAGSITLLQWDPSTNDRLFSVSGDKELRYDTPSTSVREQCNGHYSDALVLHQAVGYQECSVHGQHQAQHLPARGLESQWCRGIRTTRSESTT